MRTRNTSLLSRVSRWAGFGFRSASWLQCLVRFFCFFKCILFNCLHAREAVIQKNTVPHYYLFVWITPYYCCPLQECRWLSSQKLGFKLSHSIETELVTPLRATISDLLWSNSTTITIFSFHKRILKCNLKPTIY